MDRTLILVKPDAFARNLTGEIIARFERKGLKIAALQHMTLDDVVAAQALGGFEVGITENGSGAAARIAERGLELGAAMPTEPQLMDALGASRLGRTIFALWGISTIVFVVLRLSGDPAMLLLPQEASVEDVMRMRHDLGLDDPLLLQYLRFLGNALQGEFGLSLRQVQPVSKLIVERLPVTLELTLMAVAFALVLGLLAGIVSAVRRDRAIDNVTRVGALLGLSVPVFWQGTMLILFLSIYLRWMPPVMWVDFLRDPVKNLTIMLLPAVCLGTASAANRDEGGAVVSLSFPAD